MMECFDAAEYIYINFLFLGFPQLKETYYEYTERIQLYGELYIH